MTHELKTWPEYFNPILTGSKTFEVRKDDRCYKVGDTLHLKEYNLGGARMSEHDLTGFYTGRELKVTITFILHGPAFGIHEGYCVMGFSLQKELPNPTLTIPEAEVDAEEIAAKHGILPNGSSGYSTRLTARKKMIEAMHEYSDLRLAKAMEENRKFLEETILGEYEALDEYAPEIVLDSIKSLIKQKLNNNETEKGKS